MEVEVEVEVEVGTGEVDPFGIVRGQRRQMIYSRASAAAAVVPDARLVSGVLSALLHARTQDRTAAAAEAGFSSWDGLWGGGGARAGGLDPGMEEVEGDLVEVFGWAAEEVAAAREPAREALRAATSETWRIEAAAAPGEEGNGGTATGRIFKEKGWNEVDSGFRIFQP